MIFNGNFLFLGTFTFAGFRQIIEILLKGRMKLKDKVVLVTGASVGIGEAVALAFGREGAKVVLVSRRKEKLDAVASHLQDAFVIEADLEDSSAAVRMIGETVERYGRLDILINNAACIIVVPSEEVQREDLLKAFRTNLVAPVVAAQCALKYFRKQGNGHIINIGSPGFMMGIPFYSPYVCSKAALSAWTRTIQAEWTGTGIHISEYFPGYIKTDSRPESRIGEVEQDFLMSEKQNFLTRIFTKPKTAESVAKDIIKLALRPKILMHSGAGVKIGSFISNLPSFRLSIARQMAETARRKMRK
ncbi:MAG: SDR family NAD(P)-dependent oxidoreductase [Bacteroidetes bacterium]|nr:MAG: SDR family NAD(P)-dependent oxidoreductase [Bacteroidota bacterium]